MVYQNEPFADFTYGDHKASDYHLVRVSDGSRYNDNLLPNLTDKTAEIPGGDGMYYFNTYYKQRTIQVNVAFDAVTETDLRAIRLWLSGKQIRDLVFAERPNVHYRAKVTGTPSFKYIAFDEKTPHLSNNTAGAGTAPTDTSSLIYKGEGSITFTCYEPFGLSEEQTDSSSPSPSIGGEYPTPFTLTKSGAISANTTWTVGEGSITFPDGVTLQTGETSVIWNSRTGMVATNTNRPVNFTGKSMALLTPGETYTFPSGATLKWYERYL